MLYQDKKSAAERRLKLIIFVLLEHVDRSGVGGAARY